MHPYSNLQTVKQRLIVPMILAGPCTYSAHEDGNGCSASNLEAQLCGCGKGLFHDACVMLRTAAAHDVGMQCASCLQRCLSQRAAACLPLQNRQSAYDTGKPLHMCLCPVGTNSLRLQVA